MGQLRNLKEELNLSMQDALKLNTELLSGGQGSEDEFAGWPEVAAAAMEQRLSQLNETITADSHLGKAFQIGHSYFNPTQRLEGKSGRDWFAEVLASELKPLLQEYWFDAPDEAEKAAAALLEGW